MDMNLSQLQETVEDRGAWVLQSVGSQRVGHDLATEQQQRAELDTMVQGRLCRKFFSTVF